MSKVFVIILVLAFVSLGFAARCAESAYLDSCQNCPFNADTGKMDESCYKQYQAEGIACTSSTYPIAAAKYAIGECPQISACSAKLTACKGSTGYQGADDKKDCQDSVYEQQGVVECFAEADTCVAAAAVACGEAPPAPTGGCGGSALVLAFLTVGSVFAWMKQGKKASPRAVF
jgi:hypothetical protein